MNHFPSFTSSDNFNQGLSNEGQSQDLSIQSSKDNSKNPERQEQSLNQYDQEPEPKSPRKSKKVLQQPMQNHHKHDSFDFLNQDDAELGGGAQLEFIGPNGHKKIKVEVTEVVLENQSLMSLRMEEESERKESKSSQFILAEMFHKMRLSNGEESVFYEYDPNQQEEERLFHDSLREMFSKKCKITSNGISEIDGMDRIIEKGGGYVSFESVGLNLEDYKISRVLGRGLHGLVIKMRSKENYNAVIKLFEKQDRKAFINETIILQNVQKSKELSIMEIPLGYADAPWEKFRYQNFETEKYYGIFIKEGLGSLLDFKEYLKEQIKENQLSADELLTITWTLLDACYCLHRIHYCHRDIKPANIILDSETFLPELIDFSLSSEISKAQQNPGTFGYRMKDFPLMNEYLEKDPEDQLISNDYFALGKTMLEIAFPKFEISTARPIGDLRDLIKKLEKDTKTLAKILDICIFGDIQTKKILLLCAQSSGFDETNEIRNRVFKECQIYFDLFMKKGDYKISFQEKHLEKFKAFMENKQTSYHDNTEIVLQKVTSEIVSNHLQDQIESEKEENFEFSNEIKMLYDEERNIRKILEKDPEQARIKCCEVISQLEAMNFPNAGMQLYSTLISVLFLTDSLESALNFSGQILSLPLTQDHWVFQNNLFIIHAKLEEEEKGELPLETYQENLSYFIARYTNCFFEDLEKLFGSEHRFPQIERVCYVERRPEEHDPFGEKEIILTSFQMDLRHPQSYFFMNYCFILASKMDIKMTEEIRERVQQFVFHINIDKRREVFDLIELSRRERVLFAVLSFCQILCDLSYRDGNIFFEFSGEAHQIIRLKEIFKDSLRDEDEGEFWTKLLNFKMIHLIVGFIIHYTIKHEKAIPYRTIHINSKISLGGSREISTQTTKTEGKPWCPQKFLDSIMFWMRNSPEKEEHFIPINLGRKAWSKIYSLLFFGKRLKDLVLHHEFISLKGCVLKSNPKLNLLSIIALTMNFRLTEPDVDVEDLFTESNLRKLENLEDLTLKLWGWNDERESLGILNKISEQLRVFRLERLEIKMVKQITITDKGFRPVLEIIHSQLRLKFLTLKFNLSFITSESIEALAETLINHQELQLLEISFRNCSKITSESIESFLIKINKAPKLVSVSLHFNACSAIEGVHEPTDLSYGLELQVLLGGENPSEYSDHQDLEEFYLNHDSTLHGFTSSPDEIGLALEVLNSLQNETTFIENNGVLTISQNFDLSRMNNFGIPPSNFYPG